MAFHHRFLTRRFFVRLGFVAATLLTLVVVFYVFEKWRGQRAWNAYKVAAQQRGGKLWLVDYLPPEVPATENYAAVPCIEEIFRAMAEHRVSAPGLPDLTDKKLVRPKFGNDMVASKTPLTEWRDYLVAAKEIPVAGADSAKDLLNFFATRAPALQQLRKAASRPDCHFPTDWSRGALTAIPHVDFLRRCAMLFRLSASAHLAANDPAGAASEIGHLFRIYEALRNEPGFVSGLVRIYVLNHALDAVSEGLVSGQWPIEELKAFKQRLSGIDVLADARFTFNSERGFLNTELEKIATRSSGDPDYFLGTGGVGLSKFSMALYPSGWVRQNLVTANEYFDFLMQPLAGVDGTEPESVPPRMSGSEWLRAHLGRSSLSKARSVFIRSVLNGAEGVEARFFKTHTHLSHVQLACAIEHFRRVAKNLPPDLKVLVPAFIPAIPKDIRGEQVLYQTLGRGAYNLGAFRGAESESEKKASATKNGRPRKLTRKIDWTWRMPAR